MAALVRARNVSRATDLGDRLGVADGLWDRFMGLMGRPALDQGTGLWLHGTNGIHMMFMRFAIDAVFLGRPDPERGSVRPVLSVHRGLRAWIGVRAVRPWRQQRPGVAGRHDRADRARPSAT